MRLLLIHQNFPGQFRDLAPALLERGHELKAIGCNERPTDPRVEIFRYSWKKPDLIGSHNLTAEVDEWVRRGEEVARICEALKRSGWAPDVMLAHPGWGEALFIKDVFDAVPMVIWPELWLRPEHFGISEGHSLTLEQRMYQRSKNWVTEAGMAQCDAAVLPTQYQAKTFPTSWHHKIHVIHEGVQDHLTNLPRLERLCLGSSITLKPGVPVVTFAARNLEPMRGYGQFLKAIALAQQKRPDLQTVIAGGCGSSYSGGSPIEGKTWKEIAEDELKGKLDSSRIHHVGHLAHDDLLKLFRRSDAHCYLSRSFVLSWSVLEAMACGATIIADDNPMLRELGDLGGIVHLCDARNSLSLAHTICQTIDEKKTIATRRINDCVTSRSCTQRFESLLLDLSLKTF